MSKPPRPEQDFDKQLAAARRVMMDRKGALAALAGNMAVAEEIMEGDKDILRRLAE